MKKNVLNIALFTAMLLVSTSCATQRMATPNVADELNYTREIQEKYKANADWWTQYNNPELNKLVNMALQNNPDYLKAALQINQELYRLNLATADLFPTLSGDLGASGQRRIDTSDNVSNNFSGEIGLGYEVDLYGKIRNLQNAQEFEYQATVLDKETARLSLINSVVDLFFNLEYISNSIDLSRQNVKMYEDIRDIAEAKYKNGKADNVEYLEAKQSLLSEQNRLLTLETQFKEMETSLKNILNIRQEDDLGIKFGDILQQQSLGVNLDVPLSVLANRPDLLASQYRLQKSFETLEAENKNWYPNISLRTALSSSSDKARTTFDVPFAMGSLAVDLPFFKISEAEYQIAVIDFNDVLNQAVNEVAYYYLAYDKATQSFDNIGENYKNSILITQYYKERYNNGKVEFKDYLQAIYSENALQKDLVQQKYQIIKYENYIYKAMAGKY